MATREQRQAAIRDAAEKVRSGHPRRAGDQSPPGQGSEIGRLRTALVTISVADDPDAPISREACAMIARQALDGQMIVERNAAKAEVEPLREALTFARGELPSTGSTGRSVDDVTPVIRPWDDDAVCSAAVAVQNAIRTHQALQRTHGHDAYLMGQSRERVGQAHIEYLRATGEIPDA